MGFPVATMMVWQAVDDVKGEEVDEEDNANT